MKLKQIFEKFKNSMFLIVLFVIGMGILIALNLPENKTETKMKNTDKVRSSDVQNGGEKEEKVAVTDDNSSTSSDGKNSKNSKATSPTKMVRNGETIDIEKLNNAVELNGSRSTVVEIPFFNMIFQLPSGNKYQFLEKDAQVQNFGEREDSAKEYIYTIHFPVETIFYVDEYGNTISTNQEDYSKFIKPESIIEIKKEETIIGFSSFKYKGDAHQYLENKKNNLENGETLDTPLWGIENVPALREIEIRGTKFNILLTKKSNGRFFCEYATKWGDYILSWRSIGDNQYHFSWIESILSNTTITQP